MHYMSWEERKKSLLITPNLLRSINNYTKAIHNNPQNAPAY